MSAVLRDTTIYDSAFVKKYLQDGRHVGGRVVPLPFEMTIQSASTQGDTYNLTVIPANARVVGLECTTDGLGGSVTVSIGDSGAAARYMIATSMATTGLAGTLAIAGAGYTPTADTIVVATTGGGTPTVGKVMKGVLYVIPAA